MTDGSAVDRLRQRLGTVSDIEAAAAVLSWDEHTYMPPGGAEARGEQLATLAQLSHDLFVDARTGDLLDAAAQEVEGLPDDAIDASLVRVAHRDYAKARRIPSELVSEMARHSVAANQVWVEARKTDDFPLFAPYLARTIELSRQVAEHLGYQDQPYDALLDQFEPGMTTREVAQIFDDLRPHLIALVQAIESSPVPVDDGILHQPYDEALQEAFGIAVVTRYGYDFSRGRQDRTVHPFEISFSIDDVRITTRFDPNFLSDGLFSTLHESGHAMYEQGVSHDLTRTPLAGGTSLGVHESQSRLWENVVGRSRGMWEHFYPQLQETFPAQLGSVPLDAFYAAINRVQPSLIRVEADEVTYNLHIMLRFRMERGMLDGTIPIDRANQVWDELMEEYLGIRPETDREGILQDTHWSGGMLGYFPTYALGNILAAQLYQAALQDHPEIPERIKEGEFTPLRHWLSAHIYRYGRMFEPQELITNATGSPLTPDPYLQYLTTKFGDLYHLKEPVRTS